MLTRCLSVALTLLILAAPCAAQVPGCTPGNPIPGGLDLRDLDRDMSGFAVPDASTQVYFKICVPSNCVTRTILNMPILIPLGRSGCDEVPEFDPVLLQGRYYNVVRMNDPYPDLNPMTDPNPRIGFEYITGQVLNPAGLPIGRFDGNGVVATNSCRMPMPDAIGRCYDCWHHEGYFTITFTEPPYKDRATVFAEYHFHTGEGPDEFCDNLDPCDIQFQLFGVLDGVFMRRCWG